MAIAKVGQFIKEVRQEAGRVTWPTRKETTIGTVMVFVMVLVMSVFFMFVDQIIQWALRIILGIGG